jgi:preprotein translocase subunit YajC
VLFSSLSAASLLASPLILGQAQGAPSPFVMVAMFAAMFGVMYFIVIRPQQKQEQAKKAMRAGLVKGDEVVTQSGMIGKIFSITDRIVTLEVASGVKVRMLKDAIQGKYNPAAETSAAKADAKDAKADAKDSKSDGGKDAKSDESKEEK